MSATNILDFIDILANIIPVDLSTAANSGGWIDMGKCGGCLVVVYAAAGASGEPMVITLNQATAAAGTGTKALTVATAFYSKSFTSTLVSAGTPWTKTTQAAGTVSITSVGNTQRLGVIDVKSEQLDTANNFHYLQATIADVGATAQLGCSLYIPYNLRYIESPANKVTMLA